MQDTQVKDAVDQVRSATQQLHKAISDAATKRGGAVKADLQAVPEMAKATVDSIKGSMAAQSEAKEAPCRSRHVSGSDGVTRRRRREELRQGVPDCCQTDHRRRAGGRAEGQRSGGGQPHGRIRSEPEKVEEDHAQLHRCGV